MGIFFRSTLRMLLALLPLGSVHLHSLLICKYFDHGLRRDQLQLHRLINQQELLWFVNKVERVVGAAARGGKNSTCDSTPFQRYTRFGGLRRVDM